jgi:hypothetical protein
MLSYSPRTDGTDVARGWLRKGARRRRAAYTAQHHAHPGRDLPPPSCHQLATSLPPACHQLATSLPPVAATCAETVRPRTRKAVEKKGETSGWMRVVLRRVSSRRGRGMLSSLAWIRKERWLTLLSLACPQVGARESCCCARPAITGAAAREINLNEARSTPVLADRPRSQLACTPRWRLRTV